MSSSTEVGAFCIYAIWRYCTPILPASLVRTLWPKSNVSISLKMERKRRGKRDGRVPRKTIQTGKDNNPIDWNVNSHFVHAHIIHFARTTARAISHQPCVSSNFNRTLRVPDIVPLLHDLTTTGYRWETSPAARDTKQRTPPDWSARAKRIIFWKTPERTS